MIVLLVVGYLLCVMAALVIFIKCWCADIGYLMRGDLLFFVILSAPGPISLIIAIVMAVAQIIGKHDYWTHQVWPRRDDKP